MINRLLELCWAHILLSASSSDLHDTHLANDTTADCARR